MKTIQQTFLFFTWWCHQMDFSALLALCERNRPVTDGFPSQRPLTRSFDVFFDLHLNKRITNNLDVVDLRRHGANYNVIVMTMIYSIKRYIFLYISNQQYSEDRYLTLNENFNICCNKLCFFQYVEIGKRDQIIQEHQSNATSQEIVSLTINIIKY